MVITIRCIDRKIGFIAIQYVLIIHEVENYEAWKKVFDNAANIRKQAGDRSDQVLKYDNEPNKIVHFSAWISTVVPPKGDALGSETRLRWKNKKTLGD